MKIKIFGRNEELFNKNLTGILNIFTVIAGGGRLPSEYDIERAKNNGQYWVREGDRFSILGISNNNWANIREEGKNYIILEFSTRYDKFGLTKAKSIMNVILDWFDDCTELISQ